MSKGNTSHVLFEDIFDVKDIDPDGKKFDKVSRIVGRSHDFEMDMLLDVNTNIYNIEVGEKLTVALARTIHLDGSANSGLMEEYDGPTLMDKYEYVMHGKIFRFEEADGPTMQVAMYVSFGGLLMMLKGDPKHLHDMDLDANVFLLMRKVPT